jgi:hypothetical protein
MHIDESILDENNQIDQQKLHHVARLGGDWYCRIDENNLFKVTKPNIQVGIGIDALPDAIRRSSILTGNNLAQLAIVYEIPVVDPAWHDSRLTSIFQYYSINPEELEKELQWYAKELLDKGRVKEAWQVLLSIS